MSEVTVGKGKGPQYFDQNGSIEPVFKVTYLVFSIRRILLFLTQDFG